MSSKPKAFILDLDDTTVPFIQHLLKIHNEENNTNITQAELTEWILPDELVRTFKEYEDLIYASIPLLDRVREKLVEIHARGYKIIFMTARDERFKRVTKFNLNINHVKYDELYFNKNKSLKINRLQEKYNVVAFADDKVETVNKVRRDTDVPKVYLISLPSNRNDEIEDNIIRINSLTEMEVG